jgi:hypothetical protein
MNMDLYMLKHMDNDVSVGKLTVDVENDSYDFQENTEYTGPQPYFVRHPATAVSKSEQIKMWVMGRAPESHYEFIDALVEKIGSKQYHAYDFFKYNSGRFITDDFYVEKL